jgi:thiamine biosynthesis lipoprotein
MNTGFANLRRRDFLRIACIAGLSLAVPLTKLPENDGSRSREIKRSIRALGTTVTLTVEEDFSPAKVEAAISDAFNEIYMLEQELTRFSSSGQVYCLNQTGEVKAPTSNLLDVLGKARYFSDRTEGAFDVTVKPALDLLRRYAIRASLPSDAEFETAKSLIDFERLSVSGDLVSLEKPGMSVTLDCIGKGYVLDRVAARLRSFGIRSALIQGGGTVVAIGTRCDGSPWRIGIRDPVNSDSLIGALSLMDGAVATSGDYEDFFSPDKRSYHIVDPSTAQSPLYSHSVTVMAPTALEADPLGVTLMIKEPSEGLKLLEDFKGYECLIATRENGLVRSSGFTTRS